MALSAFPHPTFEVRMIHHRSERLHPCSALLLLFIFAVTLAAAPSYIRFEKQPGDFGLAESGRCASFLASSAEHPGVLRVMHQVAEDLRKVTGAAPELCIDIQPAGGEMVLAGTLGRSPLIDRLVAEHRLDPANLAGKWETFVIQIIANPLPGVNRALVIAGSDKRGTIYGLYDLSSQIGISAWQYWSDVPPRHRDALYVTPGRHTLGEPKVKYRGIFINDEAPALSGWAFEKFGGFNNKMYEHVFDLILRMKGNYLWPAMWGRMFCVEDTLNPVLADEYGVVIATSHHEPMMRAHAEWARFGKGPWNYEANSEVLQKFWREGIRRMGRHESVVTIGMRGDGDEPMTEAANIALLERIVADQRHIIAEETGKPAEETPQVWALYKEVQEYYDKGMRVPEDVTLLLCDDNWGNLRKLPRPDDPPRPGGYGIYYHFDYVGGPRNYKWLNTNQIERVWEQMHLAWESGVRQVWIVNVGDIKPMELPTEFFLDYAWDPEAWPASRLPEYTREWAARQFGPEHSTEIAALLEAYTRFNSRRKPELLEPDTYSLSNYQEWERVVTEYTALAGKAQELYDALAPEQRDAFYQIVLHPATACANLNALYLTVAKNRRYAQQGRARTNALADRSEALFAEDARITRYYNTELAGGKWSHMMDQTHIGYTYWQQPDANAMPAVQRISVPAAAEMGVAVEGSASWWPQAAEAAVLPELDPRIKTSGWIEIFNRGQAPLTCTLAPGKKWLKVDARKVAVGAEQRILIGVDWRKVPAGHHRIPLTLTGSDGCRVTVTVPIHQPATAESALRGAFLESNGCAVLEAAHYTRIVNAADMHWEEIPGLGRTASAMTIFPVTARVDPTDPGRATAAPTNPGIATRAEASGAAAPSPQQPAANGPLPDSLPCLEYRLYLFSSGTVTVKAFLSPTLDFHNSGGLRYAVSCNDEPPQLVQMHAGMDWESWVRDNIAVTSSTHRIKEPGVQVLRFWAVDPGVVLQRLVVETSGAQPSYLGPPETLYAPDQAGPSRP